MTPLQEATALALEIESAIASVKAAAASVQLWIDAPRGVVPGQQGGSLRKRTERLEGAVNRLAELMQRQTALIKDRCARSLPVGIQEALNSGDGVYRSFGADQAVRS